MITEFSNNYFDVTNTASGALISEKKKGQLKLMIIVLLGCVGASVLAMISKIGVFIVYAAAIVAIATLIALILKLLKKNDSGIEINKVKSEISLRGKNIPFNSISECVYEEKDWMGKRAVLIWLIVDGKKVSLFSQNMLSDEPETIQGLANELNAIMTTKA